MRVILVPIADRPECAAALGVALELGERLGADLIGCHVRAHRYTATRLPADSIALLPGGPGDWHEAMRGRDVERMRSDARALFGRLAQASGYRLGARPRRDGQRVAIWHERVGSPQKVMPIVGPLSDLVVVSRPAPRGGAVAWMFLMQALLTSTRPVLVLPQKPVARIARRVGIAWNQSAEASRALAAALPLLQQAERVDILTAGPEAGLGPKAAQVARYLRHHGIEARAHLVPARHGGAALVKACRERRLDLLVMGAYSRQRLRELIFGGFTEYMLHKSSLPVLMYHS